MAVRRSGVRGAFVELQLVARPSAARAGRRWVTRAVRAQGVPSDSWDVIELLAGELLANAVVHGPGSGDIRVRTWRYGRLVSVAVSDQSSARPVVQDLAFTATSGRGMMLVDTLSTEWGVDDRGTAGKTVWFNVDVGAA